MAEAFKTYAQFNTTVFSGRIFNVDICKKNDSEYAAITLITNLADAEESAITVTFNNNNGLLGLAKGGYLPNGREVTVTGHISRVEQVYTDEASGDRIELQRPRIHLNQAMVVDGGLGRSPKATNKVVRNPGAVLKSPVVDKTPSLEEKGEPVVAY